MLNKIIFSLTVFFLPLLFWTLTPNFFTTPKLLLLVCVVLALIVAWSIKTIFSKSLTISASPLRFGLLVFALVIIANLIVYPTARLESIIGPASTYLFLCAWAYFLSMSPKIATYKIIIRASVLSSAILAVHTLAQLTFLYHLTNLPVFMQTRAFTLSGSLLSTFVLLLIGCGLSIYLSIQTSKSNPSHLIHHIIFPLSTMIHTIALVSLGFLLLPGQELSLNILPLLASWNLALDSMKTVKTLALGVGLSNFSIFYRSVKPLFINTTTFWNSLPGTSSSQILQILTTTGLFGFLSFISLPFLALRGATGDLSAKIILVISGAALLFTPELLPILFIFFTTLGILSSRPPHVMSVKAPISLGISSILLLFVGSICYQSYRVIRAESAIRNAQIAFAANDGKTVYEQNLEAIKLFPSMVSYHLSYSQVNLALAGALSQKSSLSDEQRENVSKLVSQAIEEGKNAISLNQNDSTSWQNLGSIYRNLINVASGSDQFAVDAYAQAVALDRGNPALHVDFGGLLYQIGQNSKKPEEQQAIYNRAQNEFQTAITLKPDFPNAYYNLAKLQETIKDYSNAIISMQKTISLLGPDNPDLSKANAELDAIKAKVPKPSTSPVSKESATPSLNTSPDLAAPSPLPSPISGGPIEIP